MGSTVRIVVQIKRKESELEELKATLQASSGELLEMRGYCDKIAEVNNNTSSSTVWVLAGTLKLQDWTLTDKLAGLDIAGLYHDGRLRRGGHCRTGQ